MNKIKRKDGGESKPGKKFAYGLFASTAETYCPGRTVFPEWTLNNSATLLGFFGVYDEIMYEKTGKDYGTATEEEAKAAWLEALKTTDKSSHRLTLWQKINYEEIKAAHVAIAKALGWM